MASTVILGAGPCGLGAAWRLQELGEEDFEIYEATDQPGGLASSYVDSQGFLWDVGGHVQFSHYEDFDRVMERALPEGWLWHQRESWVWICGRFIPYPFQNNLWRLPEELRRECVEGLEQLSRQKQSSLQNFGDWMEASFGRGISRVFMRPYNFKVWAYPPEKMSYQWIGERVAQVDLEKIKENIRLQHDEVSWGPNARFRFPKKGGTGGVWKAVAKLIGENKINFQKRASRVDLEKKEIHFEDGEIVSYEQLLSTMPLHQLARLAGIEPSSSFLWSNSHIVGIGLSGQVPEKLRTKCWMYFPEENCPFYRVTVFSNYSPNNVPDPQKHWSLMCETSESSYRPVERERVIEQTIEGLKKTELIESEDQVVSRWHFVAEPGYPTPFLGRDEVVHSLLNKLARYRVYSRGRFGLWKYEVSNQDHTFMQGFEWADHQIQGAQELTAFSPSQANAKGKRERRPIDS